MGALDHQLGIVDEVTYGTPPTVTKFYEYNSESIEENEGRTEGDPLRAGFTQRSDRFTPYFAGAAGPVQLDVLNKGFGYWLKHMLGQVATTGATSPYTHTGSMADLYGDSFALQLNRPFHPAGTNQAFTYGGGKVTKWTLSNTVDANLVADLELDFQSVTTATALATASYPASAAPLTWAGGVVTIGGSTYDIDEISVSCDNGLNVERRQIRGNTLKKEPTGGRRTVEWSISADFDSLTQRNRARADAAATALAEIEATWTLGDASLTVTIPAARFDKWSAPTTGPEGIKQTLSGVGRYNGTDSPVTVAYASSDATP